MDEKIRAYQRTIDSLVNKRNDFSRLKGVLTNSLIPALQKPCDNMVEAINGMKLNYAIDGNTADKNSVLKNKENIENVINKINGEIIPAITSQMASFNSSINYYNYLIKELKESESGA